jgi:hypothetical protein
MTEFDLNRVECYSGHTYAQEPRAVIWHGRRHPVVAVEQRWRTPRGPVFWLATDTGERFQVEYAEGTDTWTIRPLLPGNEGPDQDHTSLAENHDEDKEVPIR